MTILLIVSARQFATESHAQGGKTVWDGVYTEAQGKRGQAVYMEQCAACHGDTPVGSGMAPSLMGDDFLADFGNQTIDRLAQRISQTMPANEPGKLSPKEVADVVSYLGSANSWPAGMAELPVDPAAQGQIRIIKKP